MNNHPVIEALRTSGKLSDDDIAFLVQQGRPYIGRPLPAGIKQRPPGQCFDVADELDDAGHGWFVRGFALRPGSTKPLAHAWVTPDGQTAIDASWTRQIECAYWGIIGRRHEGRLVRMSRKFVIRPIFDLGLVW